MMIISVLIHRDQHKISLEPIHLFANINSDDNRRPDILIRNPYGGGAQIILDVAITGVSGQTRHTDQDTDQPLQLHMPMVCLLYGTDP